MQRNKRIWKLLAIAICAGALISIGGCSDSDSTPGNETTPNVEAGAETTPQPEAGAEGGTQEGGAQEAGAGACTNAADTALLDTTAKRDDVASKAGACGLQCLGSTDADCAKKCVVKDTGLSDGCATCYAETIACATKNCFAQCAADPGAAACVTCRMTNCDPAFDTCSGLQ